MAPLQASINSNAKFICSASFRFSSSPALAEFLAGLGPVGPASVSLERAKSAELRADCITLFRSSPLLGYSLSGLPVLLPGALFSSSDSSNTFLPFFFAEAYSSFPGYHLLINLRMISSL